VDGLQILALAQLFPRRALSNRAHRQRNKPRQIQSP
jgi:hypothetical protein